jgi:hypothetical protein
MTSNSNPDDRAQAGTGHFMLTLCRLAAPASIRPPQAPQLKSFTFFTSHERGPDGIDSWYLHMGYFESLSDAERWVEAVHGRFPEAIATVAPAALSQPPKSDVPLVATADSRPEVPPSGDSASIDSESIEDNSLTDTRVMKILETQNAAPVRDDVDARKCDQIALLRPEDTSTRAALKEAVVQGAPVSFAVQLQWSAEPINLSRLPSLPVFRAHTLYATENHREGRSRYFLRLGFFQDPISAKQVAVQVRSAFASAAVVPVTEQEVVGARAAGTDSSSIPSLAQKRVEPAVASDGTRLARTPSQPSGGLPRPASRRTETLEQTLERLARREAWTDPDSLSESGVRHLRIEVQERSSGRS